MLLIENPVFLSLLCRLFSINNKCLSSNSVDYRDRSLYMQVFINYIYLLCLSCFSRDMCFIIIIAGDLGIIYVVHGINTHEDVLLMFLSYVQSSYLPIAFLQEFETQYFIKYYLTALLRTSKQCS